MRIVLALLPFVCCSQLAHATARVRPLATLKVSSETGVRSNSANNAHDQRNALFEARSQIEQHARELVASTPGAKTFQIEYRSIKRSGGARFEGGYPIIKVKAKANIKVFGDDAQAP